MYYTVSGEEKTLFDTQYHARQNRSIDLLSQIMTAQKECGKHPFSIVKDLWKLSRGAGHLEPYDYFQYKLYDDKKYSEEARAQFLSEKLHWPITYKCCDQHYQAITEDKWLSYNFLDRFGIRTPETIAVIDQSLRSFGSDIKITSASELRAFLEARNFYPIFAKPNIGIGSYGVFIISEIGDDSVYLEQSDPTTFDDLFENVIGSRTYLLQKFIKNHPVIEAFSPYVATVRLVNLVRPDSVVTPFAVLKIPSSTSIADNYWREDNLIADVDVKSGVIRRAIRGKGVNLEEIIKHPETGENLVGQVLPDWQEVIRVNEFSAQLFSPLRYQSLDIALSSEGPVVVEVNTGCSFELPQFASGKGFLTDDVRNFFESCGWKFRPN
jgi:hypothetical protein